MPYTVTLMNSPDALPGSARTEAERRYRAALERRLGGAEQVPVHLRSYVQAGESEVDALSKPEAEKAAAYMVAQHEAVQAGFHGLGHAGEAYFEVKLD